MVGCRQGELIGLRVKDYNRAKRTLAIRSTVYNGVEGSPKSKKGRRTIKLPQAAREALSRHVEGMSGDTWMFPNGKGNPMWRSSFVERHWKPLLESAGVPYRNFHTCRHFVASTLLAKGLPITAIARFMGHDPQTLLKTYNHLIGDEMDTIAAAIDESIG